MAIAELKEAFRLLRQLPVLWLPGIAGGFLAAALWITFNLYGTFFAGRLMVISGLVLFIFTTGMLTIIRNKEGGILALLAGGIRYYFRVLLPWIVIVSGIILIFMLLTVTFSLFGISDMGIVTALAFGFMTPTLIVTFFFDTAAVFEDRRIFDSIQRSIRLVFAHLNAVIAFLFVSLVIIAGIFFMSLILWSVILSIILYDTLEPMSLNETQLQTFTPDQFIALIGPSGMWVTALVLFIGIFLLLPVLYCYKACFFKKLAGGTINITQQPTIGEYDNKGRWYKY
jgi:hypothetical protein